VATKTFSKVVERSNASEVVGAIVSTLTGNVGGDDDGGRVLPDVGSVGGLVGGACGKLGCSVASATEGWRVTGATVGCAVGASVG
jgi:hypothetical protein